ncbi:putative effector of murein hydrolase [Paramagnetospirillum caucaseum]|uniref:Putative effector of murein hydrolase n=1 Tax=Paramagnetospirillum caucaseum TaxID=1244869 RepID=M2ZR14_9PROT|nr:LrgB family protein [Paramagnetospirillum caucaseum]EME69762.1 putative effector of murein hydrolase [Paramagnetospirillum caucaseum]
MSQDFAGLWVYLSTSPLLGLTSTLLAYQVAVWLFEKSGRTPLLNPMVVSVFMIVAFLMATGTPYRTYFDGAQFVHFLLGPATVALAVPLYNQLPILRRAWPVILLVVLVGALIAGGGAVLIAWVLGGSEKVMLSLAAKSVTTPIAMGIAERVGGIPSLTAVMVLLTGISGSMAGAWILDLARVRDQAARGLALGIAAHGIGTVRALQMSEKAGAFGGLAIGLTGLFTAVLVPLILGLLR